VDARPISGIRRRADIVFPREHIAIFVDGCFWHGCPEHHRPATKNAETWTAKIEGNKARDAETNQLLRSAGWKVIRVWEHEDPVAAAANIVQVVGAAHKMATTLEDGDRRTSG
jgi:DNA mismatch endonuclease (patch repair protein)